MNKPRLLAVLTVLVVLFLGPVADAQDLHWNTDVGTVGIAGDSNFDPVTNAYHLTGAGVGMTGTADAFHFAYYQVVRGDGEMVVHLTSADAFAQAALVLRESLDADAPSAAVTVRNGSAQFVRRPMAGSNSVIDGTSNVTVPCWLKIVRSGTTISVFVSVDGQIWTNLGSGTVNLGDSIVYVGLAVSNGVANAAGTAAARFDGVHCTFLPGEGLQVWLKADAGVNQDANGKISTWADQSGNGHDATQNDASKQPLCVAAAANNGLPTVRFDGLSSLLNLPGSYGQDNYTLYVVTRPTDTHAINGESTGGVAGTGGQRYLFGGYMGNAEAGTCVSVGTNGVSVYEHADDYLPALSVYPADLSAGYSSIGVRYQAKQARILVNGGFKHMGLVSPRTHVDAPTSLGFPAYGTYAGDVSEILLYDRALSDAECQTLETYLNAKYHYAAAPAAPVQLAADALSATQASISWSGASTNVDAYQVERLNANGSWTLVVTLGAANTSYLASGLSAGNTYTFRVSATNSVGNSPATAVSLTTPATGAEFPVSGLQMWLRADTAALTDSNGLVGQWPDRSGWGNNALQTDPSRQPTLAEGVLNGQPALHFSNGTYLHLPDHLMDGASAGELILALRSTAPVGAGRGLMRLSDGYGDWVPWGGDGNFYEGFGSSQRYGPFTVPGGLYAPSFYELTSVPGRWTARVNGQVQYTATGNAVAFPATNLWLGIDNEGTPFEGDIAEVLLFNRALTGTERSVIDAYLNAKYQVAVPPVAPTELSATAISTSQVNLSWRASVRAEGYSLERKLTSDPDSAYTEVAAIAGGEVQSSIDSGLAAGASYTYRLRANNPGGYSGYSAPAILLVPAVGTGTLPTGNLLLWLKADAGLTTEAGGEVNGWADQSGHGNNALQSSQMSEPQVQVGVVNGQPALRFDGSNDFLATKQPVLTATHDATILAVVRLPDANSKGPFVKNGLNGGFGFGVGSGTLESSGNDALGIFDYVRWLNSGSQWGMGTVLAEMTLDASGNPSLYRNGQRLGSVSGGGPAGSTGPTFIGGYNFGTARFFGGDIAEVLMFDRLLTEQERQAWEGYLNAKYNFIPPPAIPTGLSVTALSSSQVLLAWTDSSPGITGYTIERQNSDGTWSVLATINGVGNGYVDAGLPPGSTSTYRVTASSAQGNSPTSAPASGTTRPIASGANIFPVAGLQLWLRADAGIVADANDAVSVWSDQSGHNHRFSQDAAVSRPTLVGNDLNGRPAVRFDGNDDSLDGDLTSPAGREATFFVVTRGTQYQSLLRFQDGTGNYLIYPWSASQSFINSADGGIYNGINCGLVTGAWNIGTALIKAGDRMTTYRNGDLVASRIASNVALPTVNSPLILGRFVGGGEYLQADVAEVFIYDRALSDAERETVEAFLNAKYAIIAPPAAPLALNVRAISSTQANLFWSASDHSTGYLIERKNAAAGTFEQVAALPGGEVQAYIDDSLIAGATYLYRVRAENLAGASNYSEEASVSLPGPGTSSALPIDDLRLWLLPEVGVVRDSNARVSDWIDASGHGNDARQNDPGRRPTWVAGVFNGNPILRFNANAYLHLADNLLAGASAGEMLLVLRSTAPAGAGRGLLNLSAASGDWAPWDGDGMFYEGFGSSQRYGPFPVTNNLNQACLYDLTSAPGRWSARKNGEVQFASANNTVSFPSSNLTLGLSSTGICFEGEIAECVLFDHALGDSERQAWEHYLNGKYQYDPPPPAPIQLTATILSSSQVLVSWQENFQNVSGYVVERQNPDGTWAIIATLNAATFSYVDGGLSGGTLYHYRVTARNRTGDSPPSVTVGATTQTFAGGTFPSSALRIWLTAGAGIKADENGRVNAWMDQSGHSAVATQTYGPEQPQRVDAVANGNPVLHFDGHQSLALSHPLDGLTAGEIMLVVRNSAGADHSAVDNFSEFYGDYFLQGNFHSQFGGTDDHAAPVPGMDTATFNLYDVCDQAGLWQTWINGTLQLQAACGPVSFNPVPLLGQDYHSGRLRGDIAEVLVFERGLTSAERHAVERYCAGRYALTGMIGGEADADPDGDGLTNYQEYLAGTDPQDYYNAQTPTVHIVSGNLQAGAPGAMVAAPLVVEVTSATGIPLANAPVTFQIGRSNGLLADPTAPGALSTFVAVRTASDGRARALFQSPAPDSPFTSLVTATATSSTGSNHVTFAEAIVADDDTSGDGLPDGWKNRYGLDLLANNTADDPDHDGLSNFQEFYLGTNPLVADFTPEGVAVAWLIARGLDPRYDPVTAVDPNGQGLTYLQEYQFEQSTLDLWPFDEGANGLTVGSLLGFKDVGALTGGPAWVNDPDGGSALRFNLVGARVDFGAPTDGHLDLGTNGSFSVAARFRSTTTGNSRLLGKGDVARSGGSGYFLNLEGGQIGFGVGTQLGQANPLHVLTTGTYNDGGWHHVAAVFDRATARARIYVDGIVQPLALAANSVGVLQDTEVDLSAASNLSAVNPAAALSAGSDDGAGHEQFWGPVDNVGLFDKALTLEEIKVLAGSQYNQPPVVALASPLSAAVFPDGGSVPIRAEASSAQGAIAKVEFFSGTAKLGEASASPYQLNWQAAIGTYDLLARATDDRGARTSSAPVSIAVVADSDHDGLPDAWELQYFGDLSQGAASSFLGDGISNLTKYLRGLDPTRPVNTDSAAAAAVGLQVYTPLH